jgi:glutathione S-transferase
LSQPFSARTAGAQFKPSYVLGNRFSMADCIFGGAVRYLPTFTAYSERLAARPAAQRADAKNAAGSPRSRASAAEVRYLSWLF